jgi:hypothetical protein
MPVRAQYYKVVGGVQGQRRAVAVDGEQQSAGKADGAGNEKDRPSKISRGLKTRN